MSIAYVNGKFVPKREAYVHIEDRGYQFADGVYEVCEIRNGALIDSQGHIDRLERSLKELRIESPVSRRSLFFIMAEVIGRNRIKCGSIYLQITRGVSPRNHAFPTTPVKASLVMTAKSHNLQKLEAVANKGISVITTPENRWDRVDIKTVGLLPNVIAKQNAIEKGAYEAWFVDKNGYVTEGSSTNAWIVRDGKLITRSAEHGILRGITRETVINIAKNYQLNLQEESFTVKDAYNAEEAFVTSATSLVLPVVEIDGKSIGTGLPSSFTLELRKKFFYFSEKQKLEL